MSPVVVRWLMLHGLAMARCSSPSGGAGFARQLRFAVRTVRVRAGSAVWSVSSVACVEVVGLAGWLRRGVLGGRCDVAGLVDGLTVLAEPLEHTRAVALEPRGQIARQLNSSGVTARMTSTAAWTSVAARFAVTPTGSPSPLSSPGRENTPRQATSSPPHHTRTAAAPARIERSRLPTRVPSTPGNVALSLAHAVNRAETVRTGS